ncbi:GNAT family N-acetyltransferase [Grimontia sp. NTOU-MAR1]|uniref:GNAT family N-acetyltransferase n=1 Tax=Grimontia sp. NTOU-MAR1 TaxID=3111011 RepID=UPI002DBD7886|nr:GNAT family N-acetyltransferase [Grimontia sp. NTOU-MAR1]WRW01024.1 GNAT family N-acetyltransferase [Grimontia sp. NTOU-MAR1]
MNTLGKQIEYRWLETDSKFYQTALKLRYALFFEEPGLPWEVLFDTDEGNSLHLAAICDGELLAYGRLTKRSNSAMQISQMVVSPKHQRKGLGEAILSRLVIHAKEHETKSIILSARLHAMPLYEKLGFNIVGEVYLSEKTGIEHIKMELTLKRAE